MKVTYLRTQLSVYLTIRDQDRIIEVLFGVQVLSLTHPELASVQVDARFHDIFFSLILVAFFRFICDLQSILVELMSLLYLTLSLLAFCHILVVLRGFDCQVGGLQFTQSLLLVSLLHMQFGYLRIYLGTLYSTTGIAYSLPTMFN